MSNDENFRRPTQKDRYHWARLHCIGNMLIGLAYAKTKGYNTEDFTKFVEANIGSWESCENNPKKLLQDFAPILEYLADEKISNVTISAKKSSARYRCYAEQAPFISWMKNLKIEKQDACAWCKGIHRALQRMTKLEVKSAPDNDHCVIEITRREKKV